jgi:hypothetical protein
MWVLLKVRRTGFRLAQVCANGLGQIGESIVQGLDFHGQADMHGVIQEQLEEQLPLSFQFLTVLDRNVFSRAHVGFLLKSLHNMCKISKSTNCLTGASFVILELQHGG